MKKVFFASLLVIATVGLARADHDRPGQDWMPVSMVTHKLQEAGFTNITKIEADDGYWEAKGTKDGVYMKVKLDPYSGEIVSQRPKHHHDHED